MESAVGGAQKRGEGLWPKKSRSSEQREGGKPSTEAMVAPGFWGEQGDRYFQRCH